MSWIAIIVALVLAFIAFKFLMGLIRIGVIIAILAALFVLWLQGTIA